jgi:hypothetical protein
MARILIAVGLNLPPLSFPVMGMELAPNSIFLVSKLFGPCKFKQFELGTGVCPPKYSKHFPKFGMHSANTEALLI